MTGADIGLCPRSHGARRVRHVYWPVDRHGELVPSSYNWAWLCVDCALEFWEIDFLEPRPTAGGWFMALYLAPADIDGAGAVLVEIGLISMGELLR